MLQFTSASGDRDVGARRRTQLTPRAAAPSRRSLGALIALFILPCALMSASSARADATGALFRSYIASTYGVSDPEYAECPKVERFNGMALCNAQFRQGRKWRYVSTSVRDDNTVAHPFTRTWTRKWRSCRKRDRYAPGKLRSNMGYCDYLMAGDIQYSVEFQGRFPKKVVVHGTNTAGFGEIVKYKCTHEQRTARCRNSLGDAFKYTVAA
jgi:hypothetical protein